MSKHRLVPGLLAALFYGLAILTSGVAAAQDLAVGPKVGVSAANLVGPDVDDPDGMSPAPRLGSTAGLQMVTSFGPKFALQPELVYSQKGHSFLEDDGPDRFVQRHLYIELPLLARFEFARFDSGFTQKS